MAEEGGMDSLRVTRDPPQFRAPKQVSRPKPILKQEEELGADPKLGEFEDVHALSISEARAVITAVHSSRKKRDPASNPLGGERVHNDSETITKFLDYFELFSRFKESENLHALSNLLDSHTELTDVEKAQLSTLCSDTFDEAKTLIPSLTKLSDEALQDILNEMQKLQDRFN